MNKDKEKEVIDSDVEILDIPEEESTTIQKQPTGLLSFINVSDMTPEEFEKIADNQIKKVKKFMNLALRMTNESDWVLMEGNPYLQASGTQKVNRLFGVNVKPTDCDKTVSEDKRGKFYIYTYTGIAYKGDAQMGAIGTATSRDPFFAKAYGKWKPLEEVDETDIRKKAYTNFINNAIKTFLGLKRVKLSDLEEVGLDIDKIPEVRYKSKSKSSKKKKTKKKSSRTKSKEKVEKLLKNVYVPKDVKKDMKASLEAMTKKKLESLKWMLQTLKKLDVDVIGQLFELSKKERFNLLKDDEFMKADKETQESYFEEEEDLPFKDE